MPTNPETQYGVPRRFGIGTILVVTTAFASLFAVLPMLGASPVWIAFLSAFVFLIGVAQMWLFGGKNPRVASICAGVFGLPLLAAVSILLGYGGRNADLVSGLVCVITLGAPLGYLAGGLVGGVFLIMDAVEKTVFADRGSTPVVDDPLGED